MITIYELLEVDEDATNEEIEKAYRKMLIKYRQDVKFSNKKNNENELILNKMKMAYDILIDQDKRKKYDSDLSKKRAEELIKNVSVDNNIEKNDNNQEVDEIGLTSEEKRKVRKAAQNEFKINLKKVQEAEKEYQDAYNKAYDKYVKKIQHNSKNPGILKRMFNVLIFIIVILIIFSVAIKIPFINNALNDLYENNFIVKEIVNILKNLFNK